MIFGEALEGFLKSHKVRHPRLRLLALLLLGEGDFVAEAVKRIEAIRRAEQTPMINTLIADGDSHHFGTFENPYNALETWEQKALLSPSWYNKKPRRVTFYHNGCYLETYDYGKTWYRTDDSVETA